MQVNPEACGPDNAFKQERPPIRRSPIASSTCTFFSLDCTASDTSIACASQQSRVPSVHIPAPEAHASHVITSLTRGATLPKESQPPTHAVAAKLLCDAASISEPSLDHVPHLAEVGNISSRNTSAVKQKHKSNPEDGLSKFEKRLEDRFRQMQAVIMAKLLHTSTLHQTAVRQIEQKVCKCMADHEGLNRKLNALGTKFESVSALAPTFHNTYQKKQLVGRANTNRGSTESLANPEMLTGLVATLSERVAHLEARLQANDESDILQAFQINLDHSRAPAFSPEELSERVEDIEAHMMEQIIERDCLRHRLRNLQQTHDDYNFNQLMDRCHAQINEQGAINQRMLKAETQLEEQKSIVEEFACFLQKLESGDVKFDGVSNAIHDLKKGREPLFDSISVSSDQRKAHKATTPESAHAYHGTQQCLTAASVERCREETIGSHGWRQGLEELNAKIDYLANDLTRQLRLELEQHVKTCMASCLEDGAAASTQPLARFSFSGARCQSFRIDSPEHEAPDYGKLKELKARRFDSQHGQAKHGCRISADLGGSAGFSSMSNEVCVNDDEHLYDHDWSRLCNTDVRSPRWQQIKANADPDAARSAVLHDVCSRHQEQFDELDRNRSLIHDVQSEHAASWQNVRTSTIPKATVGSVQNNEQVASLRKIGASVVARTVSEPDVGSSEVQTKGTVIDRWKAEFPSKAKSELEARKTANEDEAHQKEFQEKLIEKEEARKKDEHRRKVLEEKSASMHLAGEALRKSAEEGEFLLAVEESFFVDHEDSRFHANSPCIDRASASIDVLRAPCDDENPQLEVLHVSQKEDKTCVPEGPRYGDSRTHNDCYILLDGTSIYIWKATPFEQNACVMQAEIIARDRHGHVAEPDARFWDLLGGKEPESESAARGNLGLVSLAKEGHVCSRLPPEEGETSSPRAPEAEVCRESLVAAVPFCHAETDKCGEHVEKIMEGKTAPLPVDKGPVGEGSLSFPTVEANLFLGSMGVALPSSKTASLSHTEERCMQDFEEDLKFPDVSQPGGVRSPIAVAMRTAAVRVGSKTLPQPHDETMQQSGDVLKSQPLPDDTSSLENAGTSVPQQISKGQPLPCGGSILMPRDTGKSPLPAGTRDVVSLGGKNDEQNQALLPDSAEVSNNTFVPDGEISSECAGAKVLELVSRGSPLAVNKGAALLASANSPIPGFDERCQIATHENSEVLNSPTLLDEASDAPLVAGLGPPLSHIDEQSQAMSQESCEMPKSLRDLSICPSLPGNGSLMPSGVEGLLSVGSRKGQMLSHDAPSSFNTDEQRWTLQQDTSMELTNPPEIGDKSSLEDGGLKFPQSVSRVSSLPGGKGPPMPIGDNPILAPIDEQRQATSQELGEASKNPFAPEESNSLQCGGACDTQVVSKCPPLPAAKGDSPAKGKGPPLPGHKGGLAPGGKNLQSGKGPPPPAGKAPASKGDEGKSPAGKRGSDLLATPASSLPIGRKLYWNAISESDLQDTIWAEIDTKPNLRREPHSGNHTLERVFKNAAKTAAVGKQGPEAEQLKCEKQVLLLDRGRAQNVLIACRHLGFDAFELCKRLKDLDTQGISLEKLETCRHVLPNAEEVKLLKAYQGDVHDLRDAEKFLHPLAFIGRLWQRLEVMVFDVHLQHNVAEVKESLSTLADAAAQMRSSGQLRNILRMVLVLGNYLNSGVCESLQTKGFTIDSLLKLLELKSPLHPNITLVHFIAHRLLGKHASQSKQAVLTAQQLRQELNLVGLAARISIQTLQDQIHSLAENAKLVSLELERHGEYEAHAVEVMKRLDENANIKLDDIHETFTQCKGRLLELQQYFGENTAKKTASELFATIEQFVAAFTQAEEQLQKQPKKFELLLQKDKGSSSPKGRPRRFRKSNIHAPEIQPPHGACSYDEVLTRKHIPSQQCLPTDVAELHKSAPEGSDGVDTELLEQIFRNCDIDGNGTLDEHELELAEEVLHTSAPSLRFLDATHGSRTITLHDFCELFGHHLDGRAEARRPNFNNVM